MNPRLRQRTGPRSLAAANVARLSGITDTDLEPGYMRLYTNCVPSLLPGSYGIEVKQTIQTSRPGVDGKLNVWNFDSTVTTVYPPDDTVPIIKQDFDVVAPQFQLDDKAVRSHYPPDGFADDATVFPHIVFNDPYLPWMRLLSLRPTFSSAAPNLPLPWVALVVFTPDDLKLDPSETAALGVPDDSVKAATTSGAYPMTVGTYLSHVTVRPRYEEGFPGVDDDPAWIQLKASSEKTSIIFPKLSRVAEVIAPAIKFILMSHVRELNTVGMPDAGEQDKGRYSVCISPTTGKSDGTKPVPHVVHLVSIEHLGSARGVGASTASRLGLVSLYSWNYLVVPPNPINFKDTMLHLANTKAALRPSNDILNSIPGALNPASADATTEASLLRERLSLGYSINRWRASTGEETLAFSRGPLSPVRTPWVPVPDWPSSSNTGKDFQIIDRQLGILDLTYSSAWQLGKLLAMADPVFSAALLRFRGLVHKWAASNTRMAVNGLLTRRQMVAGLRNQAAEIHSAADGNPLPARNILPTEDKVAPFLSHPRIRPLFLDALTTAITANAAAGQRLYNDYMLGSADNSDWEILHGWISDKLFLGGVPSHYLITDPVHLPPESLRFFYIDETWVDCFIDGALSTSNHLDPEDDNTRKMIKEVYNIYLQNTIQTVAVKPPVPRYGFLLRSELIRIMPDIRIVVRCRDSSGAVDDSRLPLVRLTKMNESTLLALLDCMPEDLFDIRFIQPPHQQKYVVPTRPRQLYSRGAPVATDGTGEWGPIAPLRMPTDDQIKAWYSPSTQCLDVLTMYRDLFEALPFGSPLFPALPAFKFEPWPNAEGPIDSTIMALELNDVSYDLTIKPPLASTPNPQPQPDRKLWTGDNATALRLSRSHTRTLPFHSFASDTLLWTEQAQSRFDLSSLRSINLSPKKIPTISSNRAPPLEHPKTQLLATRNTTPLFLPLALAATALPIIPGATPQFQLTVHPSTRGAAPPPDITTAADPMYSAWDWIPTDSPRYMNLIFSLQRIPSTTPFPHRLSSILITIPAVIAPLVTGGSGGDGTTPLAPEPLLRLPPPGAATSSTTLSAHLLANRHLTTTLSVDAPASGPPAVQVALSPRAIPVTQTGQLRDAVSQDASFVLRMCDVAPVVTKVHVHVRAPAGGAAVMEERGVCEVIVSERYLLAGGTVGEVSGKVVVLKKTVAA